MINNHQTPGLLNRDARRTWRQQVWNERLFFTALRSLVLHVAEKKKEISRDTSFPADLPRVGVNLRRVLPVNTSPPLLCLLQTIYLHDNTQSSPKRDTQAYRRSLRKGRIEKKKRKRKNKRERKKQKQLKAARFRFHSIQTTLCLSRSVSLQLPHTALNRLEDYARLEVPLTLG